MRRDRLALGGAIAAALAASLCCTGPLLFVIVGAGAFGAASAFEPLRPYMLSAAVLLLAYGFYRAYFRRDARAADCAPGTSCASSSVASSSAGRAGLWFASALVLAFALAPLYAGHISAALLRKETVEERAASQPASRALAESEAWQTATIEIEGMSCVSCEAPIEAALENTPGVGGADVSYEAGTARVQYDPRKTGVQQLRRAIETTGYKTR